MNIRSLLPIAFCLLISPLHATSIHTVKSGEHLNSIAKKYKTSASALQRYNNISNPNLLRVGQRLKIPSSSSKPSSSSSSRSKSTNTSSRHTIKKGETFFGVAKKYGLSTSGLKALNPNIDPNKIQIGQQLSVPNRASSPSPSPHPEPSSSLSKNQTKTPPPPSEETKLSSQNITSASSFTKVVVTKQVKLSDFAKRYQMTVNQVNDVNGWDYDGGTIFDVGSEAYVFRP